jgi:hypothetical protein
MLSPFDITIVNNIGENDILLGRGAGPNEHQGNIRYRQTITEMLFRDHVQSANPLSKDKLATKIIQTVKAGEARFLRKLTKAEGNVLHKRPATSQQYFIVVSDKVAIDKTRQALRFQLKKCNKRFHRSTGGKITSFNEDSSKQRQAQSSSSCLNGHSKSGSSTKTSPPFLDPSSAAALSMLKCTGLNRVAYIAHDPGAVAAPSRLTTKPNIPNQESARERMLTRIVSAAERIPIRPTNANGDIFDLILDQQRHNDLALLLERRRQSETILRFRLLGFRV